ncbi:MAG: hypothetical protein CYG61_05515 [Actinobacteria bacterium]|nr:MAG: hypothetical protein CYG61_05515 [Actinomycetota bacterium]
MTYSSAGAQAAASTVVTGASVQIPVTAEGSTTISFFATDNAGNVEARKIVVVNIDKMSPQTSCGGSDGPGTVATSSSPASLPTPARVW